jgi:hypothetical protein
MNEKALSKGSIRDGVPAPGQSSTSYHRYRSVVDEALLVGSSRVVRDGVRVLKLPLTWHRLSARSPLNDCEAKQSLGIQELSYDEGSWYL